MYVDETLQGYDRYKKYLDISRSFKVSKLFYNMLKYIFFYLISFKFTFINSLKLGNPYMKWVKVTENKFHVLERLYLVESIDPSSSAVFVDNLHQSAGIQSVFSDISDGFTSTFSFRVIGVLLGNIAATFLIKILSDLLWKKTQEKVSETIHPMLKLPKHTLGSYHTGKQSVEIPLSAYFTLFLCIIIDLIGDSSFALPGIGEIEDTLWAPASAYVLSNIFNSNVITTLEFVKEILPGTDILPVAVLAWIIKYKFPYSNVAQALGLSSDMSSTEIKRFNISTANNSTSGDETTKYFLTTVKSIESELQK